MLFQRFTGLKAGVHSHFVIVLHYQNRLILSKYYNKQQGGNVDDGIMSNY